MTAKLNILAENRCFDIITISNYSMACTYLYLTSNLYMFIIMAYNNVQSFGENKNDFQYECLSIKIIFMPLAYLI